MWKAKVFTGIGFSNNGVWSRAARRHASKVPRDLEGVDDSEDDMAFGFKVQVEANPGGIAGSKVIVRWLKGHDSVLFESFCGMLKRKVEGAME